MNDRYIEVRPKKINNHPFFEVTLFDKDNCPLDRTVFAEKEYDLVLPIMKKLLFEDLIKHEHN